MSESGFRDFLTRYPDTAWVDACVSDICGNVRGKRIPVAEAAKIWASGVYMPYSTYCLNARGANQNPCGFGFSDGDPDGRGQPVFNTLVPVRWMSPPGAQVLMSIEQPAAVPAVIDPRVVLQKCVARLNELELRPVVAFELEFYLYEAAPDASGIPQVAPLPARGDCPEIHESGENVYDFSSLDARSEFFDAVRAACDDQGIGASVVTSEYAPGQYEINLRHRNDPVAAADECVMFRRLVQGISATFGLRASFMAKPVMDTSGSGMHVHMSVLDSEGTNVLNPDKGPHASAQLAHIIGGLLDVMGPSMSFFSPSINGFRRYRPDAFVPVNRSWAHNNRSVACRIPAGGGDATRVEHRVAAADANPYLVLACILAGAHHGLTHSLDPGPESTANACSELDPGIVWNLPGALEVTRQSELMRRYLGADFVDVYAETKRLEYESFLDHISVREYEWYL